MVFCFFSRKIKKKIKAQNFLIFELPWETKPLKIEKKKNGKIGVPPNFN